MSDFRQSFITVVGLGVEDDHGTAVAPTAYFPVSDVNRRDVVNYIEDTGLRGSNVDVHGHVQGATSSEVSLDGALRGTEALYALMSILGDVSSTEATGIYTNTITVRNADGDLPSYTLTVRDGVQTRRFPGCRSQSLSINFDPNDVATFDWQLAGFPSDTTSAPSPAHSTQPQMAGWRTTVSLGGSPAAPLSGSIEIARSDTGPVHLANGTQAPAEIVVGPLAVSGSMVLRFSASTDLDRYLNGTTAPLVVTFTNGDDETVTLTMSQVQLTNAVAERSERYWTLNVDFVAEANATDAGAVGVAPIAAEVVCAVDGDPS